MERECVKCGRPWPRLTRDMCPACYQAARRAGLLQPLPVTEPRSNRLVVLFTNSELARLEAVAAGDKQAMSAWVRDLTLRALNNRQ